MPKVFHPGKGIGLRAPNFLLLLAVCLASIPSQSQTFTLLHSFAGAPDDGAIPAAGIILDRAGNLYGSTAYGGQSVNAGTVFRYSPASGVLTIFAFDGTSGSEPLGELAIQGDNVYGTTYYGGTGYCGVLFGVSAKGSETVILNFGDDNNNYVCNPTGGVALDPAGNFYGIDRLYGNSSEGQIFQISPSGELTPLYSFMGSPDGAVPQAIPLRDEAGDFFGTTTFGGLDACDSLAAPGCGVVYEDSSAGESVLYSFTNYDTDGSFPMGTPVMDAQGNLYGTTYAGGVYDLGIVFELSPAPGSGICPGGTNQGNGWCETILHDFQGTDGAHPNSGLVLDTKGNLYGTTYQGIGKTQYGTVFKISNAPLPELTTLHTFAGPPNDGAYAAGTLVSDSDGNLYGTTQLGGSSNLGTIYKLSR
jgi:uncharacterized repeat protein (TIGR03803 family)